MGVAIAFADAARDLVIWQQELRWADGGGTAVGKVVISKFSD